LLTLDEIDSKREWDLIKFLYDSQLVYTNQLGMRYIDLAEVDLSNVKFGLAKNLLLDDYGFSWYSIANTSVE
jgi:hypothetical protein